jgi:hypothetical protein
VVVLIIVLLLAILIPALSKAVDASTLAKCLTNQRNVAASCAQYAAQNDGQLPLFKNPHGEVDNYDLRSSTTNPLNVGMLITGGLLPTTQLGKVLHCPSLDNMAGAGGHCMDVRRGNDAGASWWVDPSVTGRIIISYQYRSASWAKAKKGPFRTNKLPAGTIVICDLIDRRFRGPMGAWTHSEGYNRAFADGSGGWFADPPEVSAVEKIVTNNNTNDGRADGRHDNGGGLGPGGHDEKAYEYMKVDKR